MTTRFCLLEQDALLHITGPDALTFLQGQTTCDTGLVTNSHSVPGAYCTPQGRVVCDFLLSQLGADHYALRMRRDIRPNSAAVFGKYIIFSKAELAPDRDDWQALAIWGSDAAAVLAGVIGQMPAQQYDAAAGDGLVVVQLDEDGTAFECYVEAANARQFRSEVEENAGVASENDWQAGQIQAGVARIESSTVEEFVPQIINYDLTGHVNFTKGCYTGQEVVARLHYRGTPKRRTYLASIAVEAPPAAGTPVFGEGGEQSIGTIVNSAQGPDGVIALVAATTGAAAGTLHVGATDGPAFTVEAPPYSLEKEA